ncbi:MAG: PDZ domain-containing protein, partial [Planctomycetota bacterium]|nr:PDZ domain-containing protein [Planctomycetota bacterium]
MTRSLIQCLVVFAMLVSLGAETRPPSLGLSVDLQDADPLAAVPGLRVSQVRANSNAARIGIAVDDRLLVIDERTIAAASDLQAVMAGKKAGDSIAVSVLRGANTLQLTGTLEASTGVREIAERAEALAAQVAAIGDPAARPRYSLSDLLVILRQIEHDLPAAAAEFKRVYPNGRFKIAISIDIDSNSSDEATQAEPQKPAPTADPTADPKA